MLLGGVKLTVLLVCVVDAVPPWLSKTESVTGKIVSNSSPSAEPESDIPKPMVVPLIVTLDGVEEERVAVPPDIDKAKSATSKVEVALEDPPYTSSENVTDTVELSIAIAVEVITGSSFTSLTLTVSALAKVFVPSLAWT